MGAYDLPYVEAEIFVNASQQLVWDLVTDIVLLGKWSPEYDGGSWLDGVTGPRVGARFCGRNHRKDRQWNTVSTVVEADPGKSFAWAVGDSNNPSATWRFDLIADGNGTLVRQHVQLGPGPSGMTRRMKELPDRKHEVIAARIGEHRHNMEATLEGLKATAEHNK